VDAPARETFLARLFALSGQHDLLTLDNWEGASLEGVVRRALRPWREEGGPPVTAPARRGFGLRLIENGLARELGGAVRVDFQPGGLVCEWVMKLE
jgi:two-component sensor histidine kinase